MRLTALVWTYAALSQTSNRLRCVGLLMFAFPFKYSCIQYSTVERQELENINKKQKDKIINVCIV